MSSLKFERSIPAPFPGRKRGKPQKQTGRIRPLLAIFLAPLLLSLAACHSRHIDMTIQNQTGAAIQLLEVDYPSASFGADSLAAGAVFHYRIQVEGDGPLKITYTAPDGKQAKITGPGLANLQQGRMEIILLPDSKAEFHPQLSPAG